MLEELPNPWDERIRMLNPRKGPNFKRRHHYLYGRTN